MAKVSTVLTVTMELTADEAHALCLAIDPDHTYSAGGRRAAQEIKILLSDATDE